MKSTLAFFLCFCAGFFTFGQTTDLNGKAGIRVLNDQRLPLENATVELLRGKDSILIKTAITDKTGLAEFDRLSLNNYIFKITHVHHITAYQPVTIDANSSIAPVTEVMLVPRSATEMRGVTVTAKKPFIQKLNDRIVVNVESSAVNAGSSIMDVLERSPGVTMDQNDNISLRGKAGVIVMIDGKTTAMSGVDLANYLKGLPSNAVERIDLITNPSAKYDAAGNSGIIDIRMKKDQRFGANGTLTAGYGQGVYPKANAGTTFNYRNKKVNIFGNYNYAYLSF